MRVEESAPPGYDEHSAKAAYQALGWRQRSQARRAVERGRAGHTAHQTPIPYRLARRRIRNSPWLGAGAAMFLGLARGLLHIPRDTWRRGLPGPASIAVACGLAVVMTGVAIMLLEPFDLRF